MKIVVSIFVSADFEKLKEKVKTAKLKGVDVVEFRADSYSKISESDLLKLKEVSQELKIPVIFTLRSREEGGKNNFPFAKKFRLIKKALALNYNYLDIELKFLEKLKKSIAELRGKSKTKIILSYHNLKGDENLEELRRIKRRMLALKPDIIKLAVFSKGERINQDILKFIKETKREGKDIIGIAMGGKGKDARLKAIPDNYFSYFCLNEKEKTAPGQLSLAEFSRLKKQKRLCQK